MPQKKKPSQSFERAAFFKKDKKGGPNGPPFTKIPASNNQLWL
jgi:hypothetical protein